MSIAAIRTQNRIRPEQQCTAMLPVILVLEPSGFFAVCGAPKEKSRLLATLFFWWTLGGSNP